MTVFTFIEVSRSRKLGPIPSFKSDQSSCPKDCALIDKGCYGENFPLSKHWREMKKPLTFDQLGYKIRSAQKGQLIRAFEVGDQPTLGDDSLQIDKKKMDFIVDSSQKHKVFGYTHKYNHPGNISYIDDINKTDFTLNLSANDVYHADILSDISNSPVVCLIPHDAKEKVYQTPAGRKLVNCPHGTMGVQCIGCGLCWKKRDYIIGFPAHGGRWKAANKIACENI